MSKNRGFTDEELNAAMVKKYELELTEEEYIDLVEAVDVCLSTIIHRGKDLIDKPPQTKEGTTFQQRIFKEFVTEHDRYMTIRTKLLNWRRDRK